eukprot:GHUV01051478.1.p1 GENE.GHUV01051478.1~~GHUV01051478.1.p1  ORF type:complete len:250 (+),score=25.88 GHUV01051478.1:95-844(+)
MVAMSSSIAQLLLARCSARKGCRPLEWITPPMFRTALLILAGGCCGLICTALLSRFGVGIRTRRETASTDAHADKPLAAAETTRTFCWPHYLRQLASAWHLQPPAVDANLTVYVPGAFPDLESPASNTSGIDTADTSRHDSASSCIVYLPVTEPELAAAEVCLKAPTTAAITTADQLPAQSSVDGLDVLCTNSMSSKGTLAQCYASEAPRSCWAGVLEAVLRTLPLWLTLLLLVITRVQHLKIQDILRR